MQSDKKYCLIMACPDILGSKDFKESYVGTKDVTVGLRTIADFFRKYADNISDVATMLGDHGDNDACLMLDGPFLLLGGPAKLVDDLIAKKLAISYDAAEDDVDDFEREAEEECFDSWDYEDFG